LQSIAGNTKAITRQSETAKHTKPITNKIESNKMKKTKRIATEHKLVNSEKELEAAATLFACMVGAGLIVLLALAMG
jgi:hypothetical protein